MCTTSSEVRARRARSVLVGAVVCLVVVSLVVVVSLARPALAETRPLWRTFGGGPAFAVAADRRGVVVIDQKGYVRALDRSGEEVWSSELSGVTAGAPALGGGAVAVGSDGAVNVFSRQDGSRRWSRPMSAAVTAVAIANGRVLAADQAGTLSAFDAGDGSPRWSVHYDGRVRVAPRVDGDASIVTALWSQSKTPAVRAFDLTSGALRWEAATMPLAAPPTVARGRVVVAAGDGHHHAQVEARDVATGAVRWTTPVPSSFDDAIEPAADGAAVAVVDRLGVATMLALDDGRVLWQRSIERWILDTRVSLTERRVVLSSFSGEVFVFDRRSGRVVATWTPRQLGGYPVATVVPARWPGTPCVLTALRAVYPPHVDLRRLP